MLDGSPMITIKIPPDGVQAYIDVYTAFAHGERKVTGRNAIPLLVEGYDVLDQLTVPGHAPDGTPARAPRREGGELVADADAFKVLVAVATPALVGDQRFCDARRSQAALALLEHMAAEADGG